MSPSPGRVLLAASLAAGLAVPASASAAAPTVDLLPVVSHKVGRYDLAVAGSKLQGVTVSFTRSRGKSTQVHAINGGKFTAKADLSSARLKASYGRHGKVSMRFRATGPARRSRPKGCTGKPALSRRGVITGTLRVVIKGRIRARVTSLPSSLFKGGRFTCRPTSPNPRFTFLQVSKPGALTNSLFGFWTRGRKGVTISAGYREHPAGASWSIAHTILTIGKPSALMIRGAGSATARAAGAFLRGAVTFTATTPPVAHFATGAVKSTFVAKFDTGAKRFARGSRATLATP
jgi:opacity protein-like surface antigen